MYNVLEALRAGRALTPKEKLIHDHKLRIRSGVKLKTVNNTDVAPTIARLLRLKLDGADGRVLREALAD
jgi:hypothetical protein